VSAGKRLFVAFEVPESQRAEAVRRVAEARTGSRETGGEAEQRSNALPEARWMRAASMHITLVFLGEVEDALCAPLVAALGEVAGAEPPRRIGLRGLGCFPPARPARVLWVGADCEPDATSLHRALAAAARALGVEVEVERVFHAHLTLARCPKPWRPAAAERLAPVFAAPLGEPFLARDAVLFESHLGAGGARHVPYARLALRGAA
jgi:2'-5' RNA ligase